MREIFTALCICGLVVAALAQKAETSASRKIQTEILFNVTGALGKATGNVNSTTFVTDPILFGAKILKTNSKRALRIGSNFKVTSTDELVGSFQRVSAENFYSLSLGVETRRSIGKKLGYYYGVDLRYFTLSNKIRSFSGRSTSEVHSIVNGPGIAPLLGFKWSITERFSLFTEASIGVEMLNNYRYLINVSGHKTVLEDKIELSVRPVVPGAVFLTFRL